jgi:hypothetical protein
VNSSEFQSKLRSCFTQINATIKQGYFFRCLLVLLFAVAIAGCHTVKPATTNSTLKDLQEWATPEPLDRLSPPREQVRAKAAMVQWTELYLHAHYQLVVKDQHFVLSASGFTETASIISKAAQHFELNVGAVRQPVVWSDDRHNFVYHDSVRRYQIVLWKLDDESPRYIAMVMGTEFLPGTRERSLVGYFELVPSEY